MRLVESRQRRVRQQNDENAKREGCNRGGAPTDKSPILGHAQVTGEAAERVKMDLDRVIGEACEECNSEADIDACDDVNVDHTTEDAAIRETCICNVG